MRRLFSTDDTPTEKRFQLWLDYCDSFVVRLERDNLDDNRFDAQLHGVKLGNMVVTRSSYSPVKIKATSQTIRHQKNKSDALFFNLKLDGKAIITINGATFVQGTGDFAVYDTNSPYEVIHPQRVDQLSIELPRGRVESMLGAAHNYTGLAMHGSLPTAALLKSFLLDLVGVRDRLTPDAAERLSCVATDLMIACIAERLALEAPRSLRGTVAVQRAKAYIEARLGDFELSPARVASATNVSLRYLQERFRERGRHVAEWIWQRRLETAAHRLSDPGSMLLSLEAIAYGCGFVSQAHFSRRFKNRYQISPGSYRRSALAALALRSTTPLDETMSRSRPAARQ